MTFNIFTWIPSASRLVARTKTTLSSFSSIAILSFHIPPLIGNQPANKKKKPKSRRRLAREQEEKIDFATPKIAVNLDKISNFLEKKLEGSGRWCTGGAWLGNL